MKQRGRMRLRRMDREEDGKRAVIERTDRQNHRKEIQPGEISAGENHSLKQNRENARERAHGLRHEVTKWNRQLGKMVDEDACLMGPRPDGTPANALAP